MNYLFFIYLYFFLSLFFISHLFFLICFIFVIEDKVFFIHIFLIFEYYLQAISIASQGLSLLFAQFMPFFLHLSFNVVDFYDGKSKHVFKVILRFLRNITKIKFELLNE
jgi:hypothetical protein